MLTYSRGNVCVCVCGGGGLEVVEVVGAVIG